MSSLIRGSEFSSGALECKACLKSTVWIALSGLLIMSLKLQTFQLGFPTDAISIQMFLTLVGQYACLLFFVGRLLLSAFGRKKHFRKYNNSVLKTGRTYDFSRAYLAPPALLELGHFGLTLYVLARLTPSMAFLGFQLSAVFAPIFKRIFLKKRIYRHVVFGLLLCLTCGSGMLAVALLSFEFSQLSDLDVPLLLAIMAGVLGSLRQVYHKWLRKRIDMSEYRVTGLEGLCGLIIFLGAQMLLLGLGIPEFDLVRTVLSLAWTPEQAASLVVVLVLSIMLSMTKSSWHKQLRTVSPPEEFFILTFLIFADFRVDFLQILPEHQLTWGIFTLVRYCLGLAFLIGRLVMEESWEIRRWGLSEELKKYRVRSEPAEWMALAEEHSIMHRGAPDTGAD